MTETQHHTAEEGLDQFIPIRKSDLLAALVEQGAFASEAERESFRQLCEMLASIYHYEYFALLERLRNDYYYFSPEIASHAPADRELIARTYTDLVQSFDKVLKGANFIELSHEHIGDAHRQRTVLRVEVKAPLDDYRDVRFYRRGHHMEEFEVKEWFGLRRRKVQAQVYDDVILMVAMKSHDEIASQREVRKLERRKIVPGSVMLKYFRNIATSDLNSLFPNVRVVMSYADKLKLSIPAIAGGIPILLKLYATIALLFVVMGFYLGIGTSVEDKDMKTAVAALTGLVALGGFLVRQWVKYQRQSLKYQIELTDNVYFRNINNNAGIFDYIIGAAEDQECKEAFLAYHFLHTAAVPPTSDEVDGRIEAWLRDTFGLDIDFEVDDALAKLEKLGLLDRLGGRLTVPPLDQAIAQLRAKWENFFSDQKRAAAAE